MDFLRSSSDDGHLMTSSVNAVKRISDGIYGIFGVKVCRLLPDIEPSRALGSRCMKMCSCCTQSCEWTASVVCCNRPIRSRSEIEFGTNYRDKRQ